ncbi:MAG: 5'-methylthioadenosine/adenosylhomocysteine nucleosidase [Acidimicrobiia bacterium]|nr:5'-methylthioadenosine/adenosylhomocysteine nucleosidase [Acidimicrobiia bacterium]
MPIAILSSMDQEIRAVERQILDPIPHEIRGQRFVAGTLCDIAVVTAISGYGKTGAAATAGAALAAFDIDAVVFGGVAGGIDPDVRIGDVVVADRLIHHDYDASPLFDRYVVPSLGVAEIPADPELTVFLEEAAREYASAAVASTSTPPRVHVGLLASGDRFISSETDATSLRQSLPEVLAVEMEGAAVAQVCAERRVPFAVFRSISDRADHHADIDFTAYVETVAAPLTAAVITRFLGRLN